MSQASERELAVLEILSLKALRDGVAYTTVDSFGAKLVLSLIDEVRYSRSAVQAVRDIAGEFINLEPFTPSGIASQRLAERIVKALDRHVPQSDPKCARGVDLQDCQGHRFFESCGAKPVDSAGAGASS